MEQKPGLAVLHMSHQHNTHSYRIIISHAFYLFRNSMQTRTINKKRGTKVWSRN